MKLRAPPALRDRVEKRSQVIENTLEPGSFFMKLRRPEGVGDKPEVILPTTRLRPDDADKNPVLGSWPATRSNDSC